MIHILPESPTQTGLALLMARHHDDMHADTPPGSNHMLDASALAAAGIRFFVMREDGTPVGMGAIKALAPDHAEIKSMHILSEHRGRGLARDLLHHLVAEAAAAGFLRLSLETGAQASFLPARCLYEAAGFVECDAFPPYAPDANSTFMTRTL